MRRAIALCAILLIAAAVPGSAQGEPLTDEERAWLVEHGPILYGYEPNYAPFESTDRHGQAAGINFDLLDAMARNLDLSIERCSTPTSTRCWRPRSAARSTCWGP